MPRPCQCASRHCHDEEIDVAVSAFRSRNAEPHQPLTRRTDDLRAHTFVQTIAVAPRFGRPREKLIGSSKLGDATALQSARRTRSTMLPASFLNESRRSG